MVYDILDAADELRSVEQNVSISFLDAVLDLIRSVAEVQRDCDGAGLQDTKINREPLQAVHKEHSTFLALFDAAGYEEVSHAVCLLIKD